MIEAAVVQVSTKMPIPFFKPRDVVFLRCYTETEDGTFLVLNSSVDHPSVPRDKVVNLLKVV